jgi:ribosomal protein L30/L7E
MVKKEKKQIATVAMVRLQHMVQTVCKKNTMHV